MYTSFNLHLGIDKENLAHETIVISDKDIDGNFLLHHFLSHCINNNGKVCLLGFNQTLTHYTNASQKLGVNLQKFIDKNNFIFIDVLKLIFDGFICGDNDASSLFTDVNQPEFSLQPLLDLIMVNITDDMPMMILLDDMCSLVNIGVPVQVIADFIHYCKTLTLHKVLSFVFLTHLGEDPDYLLLQSWLKYYATIEIDVRSLKTGYSKEISGEMCILRRTPKHSSTILKRLHFKLLDKDVKFFAPGTSSAVL